jgi:hypothetical protein
MTVWKFQICPRMVNLRFKIPSKKISISKDFVEHYKVGNEQSGILKPKITLTIALCTYHIALYVIGWFPRIFIFNTRIIVLLDLPCGLTSLSSL